jgi:hypothetical protein
VLSYNVENGTKTNGDQQADQPAQPSVVYSHTSSQRTLPTLA